MHYSKTILFLSSLFLFCACADKESKMNKDAIVSVEGHTLTLGELQKVIPDGISPEDSTLLADNYIQSWATDIILYENAQRNVQNQAEIDKMVGEYRKSLVINSYQQRLMQERLQAPTEEEVNSFYHEHQQEFLLNDFVVKGLLIKIPNSAPKQDQLKKQMRKMDNAAIEFIEKYSVQYAVSYDYFIDNWVYYTELLKTIPVNATDVNQFLSQTKFYENKDSAYTYMLSITDYKVLGGVAPFDMVQDKATAMLFNLRKMGYIRQFAQMLYDDALRTEKIKFNTSKQD